MSDDTNTAPEEASQPAATTVEAVAPVPVASAPKNRRWPMWVAAAAIALLVFAAGVFVGARFVGRPGGFGMRARYVPAIQDQRGGGGRQVPGGRSLDGGQGHRP
jgi:hypothetical protein